MMHFNIGTLILLYPLYIYYLGYSVQFLGIAYAIVGGVNIVLRIPVGRFVDKFGEKLPLIFSIVLLSFSFLIFYLSEMTKQHSQSLLILLGLNLSSASYDLLIPLSFSLITSWAPNEKRDSIWGVTNTIANVGIILGLLVSGYVANSFSYPEAFLLAIFNGFFALMFVLMIQPFERKPKGSCKAIEVSPRDISWILKDRNTLILTLTAFLSILAASAIAPYFSIYLMIKTKASMQVMGIVWAFYYIGSVTFQIPGGKISSKIGRKTLILLGETIMGLAVLSYVFTTSPLLFIILTAVRGAASYTISPAFGALIAFSKIPGG
ncbi:MAG: MFS transporter [Candidatus Heimdallarchaeota archaeon]